MPITTTYKVPSLGIEFDESKIYRIDDNSGFDDGEYWDFDRVTRTPPTTSVKFLFKDGSSLTDVKEYEVHRKVELVIGRLYAVQGVTTKWIALCHDNFGKKILSSIKGVRPVLTEDTINQYHILEEFDLDLKEYL